MEHAAKVIRATLIMSPHCRHIRSLSEVGTAVYPAYGDPKEFNGLVIGSRPFVISPLSPPSSYRHVAGYKLMDCVQSDETSLTWLPLLETFLSFEAEDVGSRPCGFLQQKCPHLRRIVNMKDHDPCIALWVAEHVLRSRKEYRSPEEVMWEEARSERRRRAPRHHPVVD